MESLRGTSRSTARAGSLPRKTLVVLQAALSLVLLSAAGLLTAALQNLENQNSGFEQDRRLVVGINPRLSGYRSAQLPTLYRRIHDSLATVPGVSSVALCLYSPQSGGGWGAGVSVDGHSAPGPRDDSWLRGIGLRGYFDVIGTPIVKGRGISAEDTAASRPVAVISEAFARKFFGNEDPIGRHFGRTPASREFEVVGVAKDARYLTYNLDQSIGPFFFLPAAQADYTQANLGSLFLRDIVILARLGANVPIAAVRQAMASVDPGMPIISIQPLREQVASQFTQQRLLARLTSFLEFFRLSWLRSGYMELLPTMPRRVNEIGVRMALGAMRHVVHWCCEARSG
jgi:hypothetical protein